MRYLLDANVLIDANRDYYPIARVPEFWDWLLHNALQGFIKVPVEIYEEVKDSDDDLGQWLRQEEVKAALVLDDEADAASVSRAVAEGYASDLTDDELLRVGRDPFIIGYALAAISETTIVTTERSKPSRQRANRHLPDVCGQFGIGTCDTFELVRQLNFTTSWRPPGAAS